MALVCVSTARCCHAAGAGRRMWQGNLRPQPSSASTRAYVPRRDLCMGGLGGLRPTRAVRRGRERGGTRLEGGLVHQQRRPPPRLHQLLPAPEIRVNIRVAESESISNRGTWPVSSPSAVLQPPPGAHAASSATAAAKHSPSCRIAPPLPPPVPGLALCLQTSPAYGLLDRAPSPSRLRPARHPRCNVPSPPPAVCVPGRAGCRRSRPRSIRRRRRRRGPRAGVRWGVGGGV